MTGYGTDALDYLGEPGYGITGRRPGLLHLEQSLLNAFALQGGQVVDKQLALQVVDFVLDTNGQQALGLQREGVAVQVQGLYRNLFRALHIGEYIRYRQAALPHLLLTFPIRDFRIDQAKGFIPVFRDVDHDNLVQEVDLGGSQPDAQDRIHGLEQILHALAKRIIHALDRERLAA